MTARVYLSGPIAGKTYQDAVGWREWVARRLAPGLVAVDPMRGKERLAAHLQGQRMEDHSTYAHLLNCSPAAITARDRFDVTRSDAMLLNLMEAKDVSLGSMVEVGWADAARVPIVLVAPFKTWEHPILNALAGWRVESLEDAVEILNVLLAPHSGEDHPRW